MDQFTIRLKFGIWNITCKVQIFFLKQKYCHFIMRSSPGKNNFWSFAEKRQTKSNYNVLSRMQKFNKLIWGNLLAEFLGLLVFFPQIVLQTKQFAEIVGEFFGIFILGFFLNVFANKNSPVRLLVKDCQCFSPSRKSKSVLPVFQLFLIINWYISAKPGSPVTFKGMLFVLILGSLLVLRCK